MRDRDVTAGALDYGLVDPSGRPVAGRLTDPAVPLGWSTYDLADGRDGVAPTRILSVALPDGHRLQVGDDLGHVQSLDGVVVSAFAGLLLALITSGGISGYIMSRGVRRRFAAINAVAERISEGDLKPRVTVGSSNDDLDHLGRTFNHMLDRIDGLLESLRQVSNDVAHDLRTPLTRLRQRLEGALNTRDEGERTAAIEDALADLDGALETFTAMLRIAQIEGGARRAGFKPLDLNTLAREVVESFAPSAEDGGRRLTLESRNKIDISGDGELVTQLIVNLVENGLRHTPPGSTIRVVATAAGETAVLQVIDDGPGVPDVERGQVLKRFYRLEQSRTTPGSGLGLALVAAVARLHDADIALDDAAPGLQVRVTFPRRHRGQA